MTELERILDKCRVNSNGCLIWQGAKNPDGYGALKVNGKNEGVHRYMYELCIEPIPEGMQICHTCDTPSCVQPDHLFVGSNKDNVLDKFRKLRENSKFGAEHGMAKLDDTKVLEIRRLAKAGFSLTSLGTRFGIHKGTVHKIVNRKIWKHLS